MLRGWPRRWRFDGGSLAAFGLVLLGLGLRAAVTFPLHKYPADADALLIGVCAQRVLDGELPLFLIAPRIGALECYLAAPLVAALGPERLPLALVPIVVALATLVLGYRLACELFGRSVGLLVLLLLAVPPPAVMFWTYMPNSHPTTLLLCVGALWLAVRVDRRGLTLPRATALGALAGIGFWHYPLTLAATVPAVVWAVWRRRRDVLRHPAAAVLVALGGLVGAAPWLAYNLRYGWPSLGSANFGMQPATGVSVVWDNLLYLASYQLPELVASLDPTAVGAVRAGTVATALRPVVLALHTVAAVHLLLLPLRGRRASRAEAGRSLGSWPLWVGFAVSVLVLNAISFAGQQRGLTVRYVQPLYLVAATALALLVAALPARRWLGVAVLAPVVAFAVTGYWLPWDPRREELRRLAVEDELLVERLRERRASAVVSTYWMAYPLTYLSGGRTVAVPCDPATDFHRHRERLLRLGTPARWALVGARWAQPELASLAAAVGIDGDIEPVGGRYLLLLERDPAVGRERFEATLQACAGYPSLGP